MHLTSGVAWGLLIAGVIFTTLSSILMRYGGANISFTQGILPFLMTGKLWLSGIVFGWVAGMSYALALTRLPITKATVVYWPLAYIATVLGGVFFLGEDITLMKKIGLGIITVGLVICARN